MAPNKMMGLRVAHLGQLTRIALAFLLAGVDVANAESPTFKEQVKKVPEFGEQYLLAVDIATDLLDPQLLQILGGESAVKGEYAEHWRRFDNSPTINVNEEDGKHKADNDQLDLTAKSFLVSRHLAAWSLSGHDQLAFGVLGGYGSIKQEVIELSGTLEDGLPDTPAKTYYKAESKIWAGGTYFAYQSKVEDATGLRLLLAARYQQRTHTFTGTKEAPTEDKDEKFEHKQPSCGVTLATAYTLRLGQISSHPVLLTASSQFSTHLGLPDGDEENSPLSLKGGLTLALGQIDLGIEPFLSAHFVKKFEHKDLDQTVPESQLAELGGGLNWKLADNLSIQASAAATRALDNGAYNAKHFIDINGYKINLGVNYLF